MANTIPTPTLRVAKTMVEDQSGDQPIYLALEDVLMLYGLIIGGTAAEAADYLSKREGLDGALGRLRNYAHYENADLALQAAVLARGIAEGQQFVDGNKRTALVAMLAFLEINGLKVEASDRDLANWILGLSADATPVNLANTLRSAWAEV